MGIKPDALYLAVIANSSSQIIAGLDHLAPDRKPPDAVAERIREHLPRPTRRPHRPHSDRPADQLDGKLQNRIILRAPRVRFPVTVRRRPMSEPDATMVRIGRGIELGQQGERGAARDLFAELWANVGAERGDPLYRCGVAHAMADVQDETDAELAWDLRALAAAELVTDERAAQAGMGPVAALYPSLHLNLGECYRKLGQRDQAREHLQLGRDAAGALPNDGYGQMIKGGLDRLAERLA